MWPILGGLAGSLLTGLFNQNSANQQMGFQERMRGTQYQTAVKDMKKAGINPMLAFSQGGAGNVAGASATMPDAGDQVQKGISSAIQQKVATAQMDNMAADTALKGEQQKATVAAGMQSLAMASQANANSALTMATTPYLTEKANYEAGSAGANMLVLKTLAEKAGIELEYLLNPAGRAATMAGFSGKSLADMFSALKP